MAQLDFIRESMDMRSSLHSQLCEGCKERILHQMSLSEAQQSGNGRNRTAENYRESGKDDSKIKNQEVKFDTIVCCSHR
jgi:hypothetical protein